MKLLTRSELSKLSPEEIKQHLNPEARKELRRIETIFEQRLSHITDSKGQPIKSANFSQQDLAALYDEPFIFSQQMADAGFDEDVQRYIHEMRDPVLWARKMLGLKLRLYQIMAIRSPKKRKVMRWARRIGKSYLLAVVALHYCYTTTNGRVLGIMPYKLQAQVLFKTIRELIERSDELKEMRTVQKEQPAYTIEFSNGSVITLLTAGVRSGGKSGSARGQEADILIVDELDLLDEESIEATYVMLQRTSEDKAEKVLWAASTPTGRKETFYRWCEQDKSFYSSWMPYYVSPFASDEEEADFRNTYSPNGFRHEVEADWGEEEDGVYPRRLIELASAKSYKYADYLTERQITLMGVDFDKYGAGSNIVVLQLCSSEDEEFPGKLKVIYRREVPKSDFTLTGAVEEIKELNQKLGPTWIYLDRGYGEKQVEDLHMAGKLDPSSGLTTKVRGVSFSETIEVVDPATYKKINKQIKPFMVDNVRNLLEQDMLVFSADDDELFQQLLGYVQVRISHLGQPVFGSSIGRDHAHDALALACLAYTLEYGAFARPSPRPHAIPFNSEDLGIQQVTDDGTAERTLQLEKAQSQRNPSVPVVTSRTARMRRSSREGLRRSRF